MAVSSYQTPSRNSSALTTDTNTIPHMRYSSSDIMSSVILVKSKLIGFRRRYVRFERGVLAIFPGTEDYAEPSRTIRLNDASSIDINESSCLIHIRAGRRSAVWATLSFKSYQNDLFEAWAHILQRARTNVLDRYYQLRSEVDRGHTSTVYEALDKKTGEIVAVKAIIKDRSDPVLMKNIRREVQIVQQVSHPNIIQTYDVFETSDVLYIVMEYVPGGTLLDFLAGGKNRITERNALRIARQLFEVTLYLHDADIVHRDIKPENVLITSSGTLKLIDFGLSRYMRGTQGDEFNLCSIVGTPAYCPPEIVCKKQYGKPVDMYGCGALLYLVISGARPVAGNTREEIFHNIRHGNIGYPEERWSHVSEEARDLVKKLLNLDGRMRPTARQAMMHPWVCTGAMMSRVRSALSVGSSGRQDSGKGLWYRGSREGGVSPRFSKIGSDCTSTRFSLPESCGASEGSPRFRRRESGSLGELWLERQKKNNALVGLLK